MSRTRQQSGHSTLSDQTGTRRDDQWPDDADRPWHVTLELRSGDPVGVITPLFSAPWYPGRQYVKPDPKRRMRLKVQYEAERTDREQARATYLRRAQAEATARSWEVPTSLADWKQWDPRLLAIVGKAPLNPAIVEAARQGNRYLLGLTTRVDPRVTDLLEEEAELRGKGPKVAAETAYGDFGGEYDAADEANDALAALEDEHDPDGIGGKRERLSRGPRGATRGRTTKRGAQAAPFAVSEG